MFRHPKYYKELRKLRNKEARVNDHSASISDQAISLRAHDGERERASDPGLKPQASSSKPQATSCQAASAKLHAPSNKRQAPSLRKQAVPTIRPQTLKLQATSFKPQAASIKLQAASDKLPDSIPFIKFQAASVMGLDYDKTILRMPHMKGNLVW